MSRRPRRAVRRGAIVAAAAMALSGCIQLPARQSATTASPTANVSIPQPHLIYNGLGFDACTAPNTVTMDVWRALSPYQAIGVYIGGRARGCSQPELTPSWVTTVKTQGWRLLPLYVGYQAPCVGNSTIPAVKRLSTNTTIAGAQAATEANDAATLADLLGIGTGSPIYYDLEAYSTTDPICTAAVQSFISAWVGTLHARGYSAGFYSSMASGMRDQVAVYQHAGYNTPDTIWFARYQVPPVVTLDGQPYIPDTMWANHQRHKQYKGGHPETYGPFSPGITINIDSDVSDGPVVGYGVRSQTPLPPKKR